MNRNTIFLIFFAIGLTAFWAGESKLFFVPAGWPEPVYDFSKNEINQATVNLGRALFHDQLLSRDNTISCTSCHSQYTAFTHTDHDLSHGIDNRIGRRNAPALMNLAWHNSFMWDGAIHHLDMQSLAPISSPDEMDSNIEEVVQKLNESSIYPALFQEAYGDSTATGERTLKAMSQFMLTFISANSKYDQVKRGEAEFTIQEQNGYDLFKKNCGNCHQEPLFTTNDFANNGLPVDTTLNDYGKMEMTKSSSDSLKFKIPTLRNIEFSYPYMHDGRFKRLGQVINHYTDGIKKSKTLAPELRDSILLTSNEKVDLVAFLLTLSDKEFLFNTNFSYPRDVFLPKK